MSKIVTILVSTIGPSVGPFSVYSIDLAGNETGPLNTIPLTRAELLSGYTLTNVPDNAVSLMIDSLSLDCPVTINVAIDGPLITTTTTSTTSTTTLNETCNCYKLENQTAFPLNYVIVDCITGAESQPSMPPFSIVYVCSKAYGLSYDNGIVPYLLSLCDPITGCSAANETTTTTTITGRPSGSILLTMYDCFNNSYDVYVTNLNILVGDAFYMDQNLTIPVIEGKYFLISGGVSGYYVNAQGIVEYYTSCI